MSSKILVGTRKGLFIVEKAGGKWKARLSGQAGVGVNFAAQDPNSGDLWAALGHGHWGAKLSRSRDQGRTWVDASQVRYPEGARHYLPPMPDESGNSGAVALKPATLLQLWCIGFGAPGTIHVGTIPGGLFTSRDDGETFSLNLPLWNHESRGGDLFEGEGSGMTHWFGTPASQSEFAPGIHSITVDPRDPNHFYIAISTAGVIETRDGGQTWVGRNKGMTNDYLPDGEAEWGHDPHYVEMCPGQPDHMWQQNHCGVFYSQDGAATWKKVSAPEKGVHFGFPISADDRDGNTAWVVPGKADMERTTIEGALFVARTEDGGQSWTQLRKGLPQENAFDVVYRHALDSRLDAVAFGSTTGNLYVSDDRGDNWTAVETNLPPIYSVRFT